MKVYLSGPMRGYPNFNFPAFDDAAERLATLGIQVFNPAAHDRQIYPDIEQWDGFATGDPAQCPQFNLPQSLAWDFQMILDSDAIVLLPGWAQSSGARAERFVAECVGKAVLYYVPNFVGTYYLELDPEASMAYPTVRA